MQRKKLKVRKVRYATVEISFEDQAGYRFGTFYCFSLKAGDRAFEQARALLSRLERRARQ